MAQGLQINPRLLAWARETAGLSPEEAAAKLDIQPTARLSAAEKLLEAERGARPVSQGLLDRAAEAYRRPLITFYLPQPPARAERGEDFRTVAGRASPRDDALLDALLRDVRSRQQLLREAMLDDDDTQPLPFVAGSRMEDGAEAVADAIRATLGINSTAQRKAGGADGLFALLRTAAERSGILVLLLGDLGSHHSDIGEEVFRGFALADDIAPFVVINDNDAKAARSFTLLHELAHLWIGASGVSGPLRGMPAHRVERFCNDVAGLLLLPPDALHVVAAEAASGLDIGHALTLTDDVARRWNVSQGVVAYRFLLQGWITDEVAAAMFRIFADRWRTERQRQRDRRGVDEGGPSANVIRRARLGAGLIGKVRRALQAETLTHTKAARILGVSPAAVDPLLRERQQAA